VNRAPKFSLKWLFNAVSRFSDNGSVIKLSYFLFENTARMKTSLVLMLMVCAINCQAQLQSSKRNPLLSFFKMKGNPPDLRSIRTAPVFSTIPYTNLSYWQGGGYTSYSENGRIRTTHLFDATGILRETRASISLKRAGRLSYWRIQYSPQRLRPLIIYTIH
jgi:hypothetical protein